MVAMAADASRPCRAAAESAPASSRACRPPPAAVHRPPDARRPPRPPAPRPHRPVSAVSMSPVQTISRPPAGRAAGTAPARRAAAPAPGRRRRRNGRAPPHARTPRIWRGRRAPPVRFRPPRGAERPLSAGSPRARWHRGRARARAGSRATRRRIRRRPACSGVRRDQIGRRQRVLHVPAPELVRAADAGHGHVGRGQQLAVAAQRLGVFHVLHLVVAGGQHDHVAVGLQPLAGRGQPAQLLHLRVHDLALR